MKLRNKKTGETGFYLHTHRDHKTGVLKVAVLKDGVPFSEFEPHEPTYDYDSLAELNEEWEDVGDTNALIKDEKIRKAVRAWAEASDIEAVYLSGEALCWIEGFAKIEFAGNRDWYKELEEGKRYTLAELCGEEQQ